MRNALKLFLEKNYSNTISFEINKLDLILITVNILWNSAIHVKKFSNDNN